MSSDSPPPEHPTRAARRAAERERARRAAAMPGATPLDDTAAAASATPAAPAGSEAAGPGAPAEPAPWVLSRDAAEELPAGPRAAPAAESTPPGPVTGSTAPVPSAAPSAAARRPRPRATVFSVLGEILITAGVLIGLFLGWQLWFNDMVERSRQNSDAAALTEQWNREHAGESAPGVVPVVAQPEDGAIFANLRIPRFGADFAAPLAGGVSKAKTLDKAGIGHYPDTQLPGESGNFALAGHRNTHGAPLNLIADFRVGDEILVETPEGWYTYVYRNTEYVAPTAVDVLNPMPRTDTAEVTDSLITLTSCNPKMSTAERIIAYGVFESFTPRDAGPPASLAGAEEG